MPPASSQVIELCSEDETDSLARRISANLKAGDVLLLEGPIGAGKTRFARAVIQARLNALGLHEDVPSPTYTLVQTYKAGGLEIWHADLYRLSNPGEAIELGLDEALNNAICLIEWPDRLGLSVPDRAITLNFALRDDPGHRSLTVRGDLDRWCELYRPDASDRAACGA